MTERRRRIAVAGCQHETNTFAPMFAPYEEFVKADAWPGLTRGDDLFRVMRGKNLPLAGFMDAAGSDNQILPVLWCAAEPSSYVTRDAFERISGMICDGLRDLANYDAVYLDLHGAMVAEHCEDGEGELLSRVRRVIGTDMPLVVSLDLHANVTERMVEHTDGFTIFRTYPHIDMALTGKRAYKLLDRFMSAGQMYKAFRKLPFLIPLSAQCTKFEPNRSIYSRLAGMSRDQVWNVDFAPGFPAADIRECGPALVAYGANQQVVEDDAGDLYQFILSVESAFENPLLAPDAAVRHAVQNAGDKPVVLADVQDNPGAGGSSDTTGLLDALVRNHASRAVLAILNDPEVAAAATAAGVGARMETGLGGKSGQQGQSPYKAGFIVEKLGTGKFVCTGTMYKGMEADIGPLALLRVDHPDCDVRIIVGSERMQCLDLSVFRHIGVEPEYQGILAIKSTVHFRADFDPIAGETLLVEAPGAHPCRLLDLPYQNLREGVRLEPMGPVFKRH